MYALILLYPHLPAIIYPKRITMLLAICICLVINLFSTFSFYKKREKLLEIAAAVTEPEEQVALRRAANNQIWRIVVFGIATLVSLISLLMVLSVKSMVE